MNFGELTVRSLSTYPELTKMAMPQVARACLHSAGRYNAEKVADGLISGKFRLWGIADKEGLGAVAVTTVLNKAFTIVALGGPAVHEFVHYLDRFIEAAREVGCDRIVVEGPAAWRGMLPDGWKAAAVVYESRIDGTQTPSS